MTKLSIKVKIANREYPMTVLKEDEEKVRIAAKALDEQYKRYRDRFSIDDRGDILAMAGFDTMMKYINIKEESEQLGSVLKEKLTNINHLFDS